MRYLFVTLSLLGFVHTASAQNTPKGNPPNGSGNMQQPPQGGPGNMQQPPQGGPGNMQPPPQGGPGNMQPPPQGGPGNMQPPNAACAKPADAFRKAAESCKSSKNKAPQCVDKKLEQAAKKAPQCKGEFERMRGEMMANHGNNNMPNQGPGGEGPADGFKPNPECGKKFEKFIKDADRKCQKIKDNGKREACYMKDLATLKSKSPKCEGDFDRMAEDARKRGQEHDEKQQGAHGNMPPPNGQQPPHGEQGQKPMDDCHSHRNDMEKEFNKCNTVKDDNNRKVCVEKEAQKMIAKHPQCKEMIEQGAESRK